MARSGPFRSVAVEICGDMEASKDIKQILFPGKANEQEEDGSSHTDSR